MNLNGTKIIFKAIKNNYLGLEFFNNTFELSNEKNDKYIVLLSWNTDETERNLKEAQRLSNDEHFYLVDQDNNVSLVNSSRGKVEKQIGTLNEVDAVNDKNEFFYQPTTKRYFIVKETK